MSEEVEEHVLKRFQLVKKVGSGAYGHVWKAINRRTRTVVALKKIFDAFQHSTDAQRTFREITLLNELNHQNIIKLHTVIRAQNDKDIYLVFEYMEADLHNVISQRILQDIHIRFVMYQLTKALKYLHSAQLIHRDLKPSNILVNSDCNIKVCDFGLVRCLAADKAGDCVVLTEEVATRWYRAPEVLLGSKSYDKPADIWSLGCILAEMLLNKPIFPGNSTLNQLERILSFTGKPSVDDINSLDSELAKTMIDSIKSVRVRSPRQWFGAGVPAEGLDLVERMLDFNPSRRPTAVEILQHPYMAQFHNPSEESVSPTVIRPPISDNKKLSLKEYRNLLYEQIKKLYSKESQSSITTAVQPPSLSPNSHFHRTSDMISPKRKPSNYSGADLMPAPRDTNVSQHSNHQKSTHSYNSSCSKKKYVGPSGAPQGGHNNSKTSAVDYQAQIRSLLEDEAKRLQKKTSGYLQKRPSEGYMYPHGMDAYPRHQSPSYSSSKMKEYPVIRVDKENKKHI